MGSKELEAKIERLQAALTNIATGQNIPFADSSDWAERDYAREVLNYEFPAEESGYGCHLELEPDMEPDECVIDTEQFDDCMMTRSGLRDKLKCPYWCPKVKKSKCSVCGSNEHSGNLNIVEGKLMCDYCHAKDME
jgi:hypothetical protein